MPIRLDKLVCIVTGSDEGVGNGLVHGFLNRGAHVVAGVLDLDKALNAVYPAKAIRINVQDREEVLRAMEMVVELYGRIDVLVNNAGIYPRKVADEITEKEWMKVVDTNLHGAWRCCNAVIP